MRQLHGVYTQGYNRRQDRSGHLFQGPYKVSLVESNAYLPELSRYIVLNPVRVGTVRDSGDWRWSSYRATAGLEAASPWLTTGAVLAAFSGKQARAGVRYRQFVQDGLRTPSIWSGLNKQVSLGDDGFVERIQCRIDCPDPAVAYTIDNAAQQTRR
jgi:hypothetical protein